VGFIQAFTGALGGTFAEQWIDFYTVPNVQPTAALYPVVKKALAALGQGDQITPVLDEPTPRPSPGPSPTPPPGG
jgi:hypothetical protein